jgi:hypothetical protein
MLHGIQIRNMFMKHLYFMLEMVVNWKQCFIEVITDD